VLATTGAPRSWSAAARRATRGRCARSSTATGRADARGGRRRARPLHPRDRPRARRAPRVRLPEEVLRLVYLGYAAGSRSRSSRSSCSCDEARGGRAAWLFAARPRAPPRSSSSSLETSQAARRRKSSSTFDLGLWWGVARWGIFPRGHSESSRRAVLPRSRSAPRTREPMSFKGKIDPRVLDDSGTAPPRTSCVVMRTRRKFAKNSRTRRTTAVHSVYRVVSSLEATAESAQTPLRRELARRGCPFVPYGSELDRGEAATAAWSTGSPRAMTFARIRGRPRVPGVEAVKGPHGSSNGTGVEWNSRSRRPGPVGRGSSWPGLVYANADTGVSGTHPALKNHYRAGRETVSNDYNWHDSITTTINGNGTNPCGFDSQAPCDDQFHGNPPRWARGRGRTTAPAIQIGSRGRGANVDRLPEHGRRGRRAPEHVHRSAYPVLRGPDQPERRRAPTRACGPTQSATLYACPPVEQCSTTSLQTARSTTSALSASSMAVSAANSGPACFDRQRSAAILRLEHHGRRDQTRNGPDRKTSASRGPCQRGRQRAARSPTWSRPGRGRCGSSSP
jgi:hypothetical protein